MHGGPFGKREDYRPGCKTCQRIATGSILIVVLAASVVTAAVACGVVLVRNYRVSQAVLEGTR